MFDWHSQVIMLFNTYQKKIPHLLKKQRKRKEKYNVKDYDMMVKKIEKMKKY